MNQLETMQDCIHFIISDIEGLVGNFSKSTRKQDLTGALSRLEVTADYLKQFEYEDVFQHVSTHFYKTLSLVSNMIMDIMKDKDFMTKSMMVQTMMILDSIEDAIKLI